MNENYTKGVQKILKYAKNIIKKTDSMEKKVLKIINNKL